MREEFFDFKLYAGYELASYVRESISENYYDSILDLASDYENQPAKPCKNTLLHDHIHHVIYNYVISALNDAAYDEDCGYQVFDWCQKNNWNNWGQSKIKHRTLGEVKRIARKLR